MGWVGKIGLWWSFAYGDEVGISVHVSRFCVFDLDFLCHHGYHNIDLDFDLEIMMGIKLDGWKDGFGYRNWNVLPLLLIDFLGVDMKIYISAYLR